MAKDVAREGLAGIGDLRLEMRAARGDFAGGASHIDNGWI
jgi:hypothetical protein